MKGAKNLTQVFFFLTIVLIVTVSATALVVSVSTSAQGQIALGAQLVWEQTFGGSGDDRAFYATATNDGFLVVGSSTSFEQDKTVACMVKLDSSGNLLWNKTYAENNGAEFRYAHTVTDGFLLVGNTFQASGGTNGYVMKVDTQGNRLWTTQLNEYGTEGIDKLFSATMDGDNLVAVGLTESFSSNSASNVWAIKLNGDGNVIWNRTFGQTVSWAGRSITLTSDSGYMIAGYAYQPASDNYDFLVLKLDADGNLLWNQTYGGSESDKAYSIAETADGFTVAGDTRSQGSGDSDAWIIKISPDGAKLWERTVGGSNFDSPTYMVALQDGSYVVAGTTFSFGNGLRDFWLFKLNSNGEVISTCSIGRDNYEEAYIALPTGDGNYLMAGWTKSLGSGHYDFYIIKLKL